jgi:translation initiation factor 1A
MEEEIRRVRMPRNKEVICIIEARLGTNKISARCQDNKVRICRIPGKMKKRIWMRENDAIIVKPWDIDGDRRADVAWVYNPTERNWLRRKKILTL